MIHLIHGTPWDLPQLASIMFRSFSRFLGDLSVNAKRFSEKAKRLPRANMATVRRVPKDLTKSGQRVLRINLKKDVNGDHLDKAQRMHKEERNKFKVVYFPDASWTMFRVFHRPLKNAWRAVVKCAVKYTLELLKTFCKADSCCRSFDKPSPL